MSKDLRKGINVLSLCDGMSCGMIALERAGFKVDNYYASEIKDIAIKVSKANYPQIKHIGDVNDVRYENGELHWKEQGIDRHEKIDFDIVLLATPCQSVSVAIKSDMRVGLEDKIRSGLFYKCHEVLKSVNPKYFLLENVASMREEDRDIFTSHMGVPPIMIDSKLVAPCMRKRYYWTNIPNVTQPKKVNIKLQEILEEGYVDREKGRCLTVVSENRPPTTPVKMFHRYYSIGFSNLIFKDKEHYNACKDFYDKTFGGKRAIAAKDIDLETEGIEVFNGLRHMTQNEIERCQTLPSGYTKCLNRAEAGDVVGDGWTVDVISHILSFIP